MSKRLTDTRKWDKVWFRKLPPKYKCFWIFLCDNCDHAGIWEIDLETAEYFIGENLDMQEIKQNLGEHLKLIGNDKWFIRDFIDFQYSSLTDNNRLHHSVVTILKKYNIPITSPLQGAYKGVKAKEQEQIKEQEKAVDPKIMHKDTKKLVNKLSKDKSVGKI